MKPRDEKGLPQITEMDSSRNETWIFLNIKISYTSTVITVPSIYPSLHPKPNHLWVDLDLVNKIKCPCSLGSSQYSCICSSINFWGKKASFLVVLNKYLEKINIITTNVPLSLFSKYSDTSFIWLWQRTRCSIEVNSADHWNQNFSTEIFLKEYFPFPCFWKQRMLNMT